MNQPLLVLHLEDDPADVKLVHAALKAAGMDCQITPARTHKEFEEAFLGGKFDVILADYNLPNYDGITALRLVQKFRPDIPFIFVSGAMGEEAAIEGLTGGAWDYVSKAKLFRLVPAITRALRDAENRRELKMAEEANERSRIELKAIYENTPVRMCVVEANHSILFANQAFFELTGKSEGDLKGKMIGQVLGCGNLQRGRDRCGFGPKCPLCPLRRALENTFRTGMNHRAIEYRATFDTGMASREAFLLCSTALLKMADRANLLLCVEDITELKTAEEERDRLRVEFLQAQKMDAYGRLAGGVAHDFNNLLTVIISCCELGLSVSNREKPIFEYLEMILKTSNQAANLTRQLLAFSRKQVLQARIIDLNSVVSELDKMLQRIIGEQIVLQTTLEKGIGPILADPGQIGQVILNLVVNARDAMPQGGKVTISTHGCNFGGERFPAGDILGGSLREISPGPYVCLSIADSGVGIPEEIKEHLIEPFFTTKAPGKGTGLGLPTVFGIVKQSRGHMLLRSSPGKGSIFHLLFPVAAMGNSEETVVGKSRTVLAGGETILVVEDSEDMRLLIRQILEIKGYKVITAGTGTDALRLTGQGCGAIQLLVTDVIMPGMTGPQLWKTLLETRPEIRVLFISGYSPGEIPEINKLHPDFPYLQKPFSGDDLVKRIREILESQPQKREMAEKLVCFGEVRKAKPD